MALNMKLKVSIARQEMQLLDNDGHTLRTWPVSTSRFGLGSTPDSNFTPLGRFRIVEEFGYFEGTVDPATQFQGIVDALRAEFG